jgi:MFS family permease
MGQIVLHEGTFGTTVLIIAQGFGAVLMGLALGPLTQRFGSRRVLLAVLWSLPVALVAYAAMPTLALAAIAIFFVGMIYLGALSSFMSIAQIRAPAAIRGRVVSLLAVVLGVLYPLGAILQGAIGHQVGLRETTAAAAVLMLLALFVMRVRNPRFADALDEPPVPVDAPDVAGARRDGCEDVDTDRLGLAPDEIPIPSADPS